MAPIQPVRVTLVALPEAIGSIVNGFNDLLNSFDLLSTCYPEIPHRHPFETEIVGLEPGPVLAAGGFPIATHRTFMEVAETDIVILPAVMIAGGEWEVGRYPAMVAWLRQMHAQGAMLTSACSGALLLAETGLLDHREATLHWIFQGTFKRNFPEIRLSLEKPLIITGANSEFLMCGGSTTWQLLALYLIARHVGTAAAQAVAKFYAVQWFSDGLTPYIGFHPKRDHGDTAIERVQAWLETNYSVGRPVDEMVRHSGLSERTFKRRFQAATGHGPIEYVQLTRIDVAKQRLEQSDDAIDDVAWQVGYEDAAFFRRLFKRVTNLTPGAFRRQFRLPEEFAAAPVRGQPAGSTAAPVSTRRAA